MTQTHSTLAHSDRVHGVTPSGKVVRTGTYLRFETPELTVSTDGREYEAIVMWDGDDYESRVSFQRLALAS